MGKGQREIEPAAVFCGCRVPRVHVVCIMLSCCKCMHTFYCDFNVLVCSSDTCVHIPFKDIRPCWYHGVCSFLCGVCGVYVCFFVFHSCAAEQHCTHIYVLFDRSRVHAKNSFVKDSVVLTNWTRVSNEG